MVLTHTQLDDLIGFDISDDTFFSEGAHIILDGAAWVLAEECGEYIILKETNDISRAIEDMTFFSRRGKNA